MGGAVVVIWKIVYVIIWKSDIIIVWFEYMYPCDSVTLSVGSAAQDYWFTIRGDQFNLSEIADAAIIDTTSLLSRIDIIIFYGNTSPDSGDSGYVTYFYYNMNLFLFSYLVCNILLFDNYGFGKPCQISHINCCFVLQWFVVNYL